MTPRDVPVRVVTREARSETDRGSDGSEDGVPRRSLLPRKLCSLPGSDRVAVLVLLAVCSLFFFRHGRAGTHRVGFGGYHLDLDVYRLGIDAWLHGRPVYGPLPQTASGVELPFTYPPFAAIAMSPLGVVNYVAASVLLTLLSIASLVLVVYTFLNAAGAINRYPIRVVSLVSAGFLLLDPMRETIGYGQINALLMLLVTVDCLVPNPRWPRGVLVGLAAAVKLTPLGFVLFFVLRSDRSAVRRAALTFLAAGFTGVLLAPRDSAQYWLHSLPQADRVGKAEFTSNQTITAVLARLGVDGSWRVVSWLALAVVIASMTAVAMRGALAEQEMAWALGLNAIAVLLISPISWSHHWVWMQPAMLALVLVGLRRGSRVIHLAVSGLVLIALAPQWWLPNQDDRELRWSWWEQIVGNAYMLFACMIIGLAAGGRLCGRTDLRRGENDRVARVVG